MQVLGRMIVFSAVSAAVLSCQGCVQTDAVFVSPAYTAPTSGALTYDSVALVQGSGALAGPVIGFSGVYERAETVPQLAFKPPQSYSGPIDLSADPEFSTSRLYSSSTLTEFAGNRKQDSLSPVPRESRRLSAELSLSATSAQTGLGFDVGVAPRISITRDGAFATRRFGGEVRIGQNFDKRGDGDSARSWFLFAGADGEALVWEPNSDGTISVADMALRDKVTVGDIQAGVSFQQGPGQVSFSYIRREVEYRERNLGASENEDFAGVSFTIRR